MSAYEILKDVHAMLHDDHTSKQDIDDFIDGKTFRGSLSPKKSCGCNNKGSRFIDETLKLIPSLLQVLKDKDITPYDLLGAKIVDLFVYDSNHLTLVLELSNGIRYKWGLTMNFKFD